MQNLRLKKFLEFKTIWVLLLSTMLFTMASCLDDDGGTVIPAEPVAYVSWYQGSPAVPDLDIYVDNNRLNLSGPFEYSAFTGYSRYYTGERDFKVTPYNASNTLVDSTITLKADSLYSLFVIGGDANDLDLLFVEDNIPDDKEDKALVRLVHLSPDAPEVNVSESDSETILFEESTYKSVSDFIEIDAGSTTLEVQTADGEEVVATVDDYNFIEGRVYTIVVRGYATPPAGNSNNLRVQIVPYFFSF